MKKQYCLLLIGAANWALGCAPAQPEETEVPPLAVRSLSGDEIDATWASDAFASPVSLHVWLEAGEIHSTIGSKGSPGWTELHFDASNDLATSYVSPAVYRAADEALSRFSKESWTLSEVQNLRGEYESIASHLYPATESLRDSPVRYALLYHVSILTQAVEKMRGRDASACDDHLHDPSVPFHFTEDHGVSLEDDKEIATSVSALTTCALGEGSACGCCGNYSGCCSVSSYLCYLHDQSCESCGWWCGWQCVPGPC